jgi:hypothetical protein
MSEQDNSAQGTIEWKCVNHYTDQEWKSMNIDERVSAERY